MNNDLIGKVVNVSKDGITWHRRRLLAVISEPSIRKRYITDVRTSSGIIQIGETSKWVYCKPLSVPRLMSFDEACSYLDKKCIFSDSIVPNEYERIPTILQEILITKDRIYYVAQSGCSYKYVFREDTDGQSL